MDGKAREKKKNQNLEYTIMAGPEKPHPIFTQDPSFYQLNKEDR
jgi:hypothetical protein